MHKLHFVTFINAPREKVWDTMLNDDTYRTWTNVFHYGSYYKGSWDEGSKILFLGPEEDGTEVGMVSRIKESRRPEYVAIEHLGMIRGGKEIMEGEEIENWKGAIEAYTFNEKEGGTELMVDMDVNDTDKAMMEDLWPKALAKLKEIAEA